MSFNGSGTYSPPASSFPEVADTLIDANRYDAVITDLAAGLSNTVCKDGQTTLTAHLPFNGFKATNMAMGTARTDSTTLANIQDGTGVYVATVAGTVDAITLGPSPAIGAYAAGQTFRFVAVGANTGAVTLSVSGLTAKALTKNGTTALVAGDVVAGNMIEVSYDGTRFILGTLGGSLVATVAAQLIPATTVVQGLVELATDAEVIAGTDTGRVITPSSVPTLIPPGVIWEYGGSSAPTGWLLMNQDVSRTTYATLFGVVGTTYGAGDGSTTFGLRKEGRVTIQAGTGTTVEVPTTSSANGFVVASNNTKWISGMPVVLSAFSGFTSSATAGPTYYAVRVSATNLRLATTLALAQAGTPDVTLSGSGSATITYTLTARTRGEIGGEQAHAESITELMAHTHTQNAHSHNAGDGSLSGGGGNDSRSNTQGSIATTSTTATNQNTGGNAAMNIMQPFVVSHFIVKY